MIYIYSYLLKNHVVFINTLFQKYGISDIPKMASSLKSGIIQSIYHCKLLPPNMSNYKMFIKEIWEIEDILIKSLISSDLEIHPSILDSLIISTIVSGLAEVFESDIEGENTKKVYNMTKEELQSWSKMQNSNAIKKFIELSNYMTMQYNIKKSTWNLESNKHQIMYQLSYLMMADSFIKILEANFTINDIEKIKSLYKKMEDEFFKENLSSLSDILEI
ncbi:MAG TPA: hypothetical protein EYP22_03575 [Methanosarcinales archaeon]|nr:hypothetical protein [Methanosarcinales archaeon]